MASASADRKPTYSERAARIRAQADVEITRATEEVALLQNLCELILDAGHYHLAWYGKCIEDRDQSISVVASTPGHESYVDNVRVSWGDNEWGQGPTGRAIRSREAHVIHDIANDPSCVPWRELAAGHDFYGCISIPVLVGGAVDGILIVYTDVADTFDDAALALLDDIAVGIGRGLSQLRALTDV